MLSDICQSHTLFQLVDQFIYDYANIFDRASWRVDCPTILSLLSPAHTCRSITMRRPSSI